MHVAVRSACAGLQRIACARAPGICSWGLRRYGPLACAHPWNAGGRHMYANVGLVSSARVRHCRGQRCPTCLLFLAQGVWVFSVMCQAGRSRAPAPGDVSLLTMLLLGRLVITEKSHHRRRGGPLASVDDVRGACAGWRWGQEQSPAVGEGFPQPLLRRVGAGLSCSLRGHVARHPERPPISQALRRGPRYWRIVQAGADERHCVAT